MTESAANSIAANPIYAAASLGDVAAVRTYLAQDPASATATGGARGWDALTCLCFSPHIKAEQSAANHFVETAQALLDAGANANTGWTELNGHDGQPVFESALYGASGVSRHPGLTQLLLAHGADPNDGETPYHAPEGYDNSIVEMLLASGRLNATSLAVMLARKSDWHDEAGMRLVLAAGADPNVQPKSGGSALHHAVQRDNSLALIDLLLDDGADASIRSMRDGKSAMEIAARRGRADVLRRFKERGTASPEDNVERLIAACAEADRDAIYSLLTQNPDLVPALRANEGTLLAEFAGNGNVPGLGCLLDLGLNAAALYRGDIYYGLATGSTALHAAAWRARHRAVQELIARGTPVNARDAQGRSALTLAVKACVDSYWTHLRSPDSVEALLQAGADTGGIASPSGYADVDELLRPLMES